MVTTEYQTYLADTIRSEGAIVKEYVGWYQRTQPTTRDYTPVGLLNHHTAPPVPYPVARLEKKCNLNIKPDGTVWVIAAGYQYDSGYGDQHVIDAVSMGLTPPPPTDTYKDGRPHGVNPGVPGNPWFIDIEVDHPGDGSPIPQPQFDALIDCNVAVLKHNGWDTNRLIGHREWTTRKIDPRWRNPGETTTNPMPTIRRVTQERLNDMQFTEEEAAALKTMLKLLREKASSVYFVGPAVDLIRHARNKPLHTHDPDPLQPGDTVRLVKQP